MLAAATAILAVAPVSTASARQNAGQYINVNICNLTSAKIFVALSYLKEPGSSDWIVEGWKNIGGNSCQDYDLPRTGWFYYYAEDEGDGYWGADDIQLCVEHPGPFRRVNRKDYTCAGSELKGFRGVDPSNSSSYTVNIRP
jgi:uncharacterized membrane protein